MVWYCGSLPVQGYRGEAIDQCEDSILDVTLGRKGRSIVGHIERVLFPGWHGSAAGDESVTWIFVGISTGKEQDSGASVRELDDLEKTDTRLTSG